VASKSTIRDPRIDPVPPGRANTIRWDAAILEAQLARFKLVYHDGPELTPKQLRALERA
jgi:hypothetical protein